MERGAIYRLKEGVSFPGGFFNYGYKWGLYVGDNARGWPRFMLGNGVRIAVNVENPDDILEKIDE